MNIAQRINITYATRLFLSLCVCVSSMTFSFENKKSSVPATSTTTKVAKFFFIDHLYTTAAVITGCVAVAGLAANAYASSEKPTIPTTQAPTLVSTQVLPVTGINTAITHPARATTVNNYYQNPPTPSAPTASSSKGLLGGAVGFFLANCSLPSLPSLGVAAASLGVACKTYAKTCEVSDTLNQTRQELAQIREENSELHNKTHNELRLARHQIGGQLHQMERNNKALHEKTQQDIANEAHGIKKEVTATAAALSETMDEAHKENAVAHVVTREQITTSQNQNREEFAKTRRQANTLFMFSQVLSNINTAQVEKTIQEQGSNLKQALDVQAATITKQVAQLDRMEQGINKISNVQNTQNTYVQQNGVCVPPASQQTARGAQPTSFAMNPFIAGLVSKQNQLLIKQKK